MSAATALLSGLVSSQTSEKKHNEVDIDVVLNRWKKLRAAVRESALLHTRAAGSRRALMVTLTYAEVDAQQPRDVAECLTHMRKWCQRNSGEFRYQWVGELQGRGALHYHILVWVSSHLKLPYPDQMGWWPHGCTEVKPVRCAIAYVTKYASKMRSKLKDGAAFPKGFRMHGCGGLPPVEREHRSHTLRPQWIRDQTKPEDIVRPAKGGGFFSKLTGQVFKSPWRIVAMRFAPGIGMIITVRREEL